jgi:anti-sigma regulatory factor (Ser/Thr protein kinase)
MASPLPELAASHQWPRPALGAAGLSAEHDAWHRLVIFGRPEQVSAARAFVRRVLGLGHPGCERVALLTSELVTNSVNHSNSRLDGGLITVTVRAAADRVRVEVRDDGGPTAPMLRCDDDLAEAGRGLRLVDAYSLTWDHYCHGTGTVTWFECLPEPLPLRVSPLRGGSRRGRGTRHGPFGPIKRGLTGFL